MLCRDKCGYCTFAQPPARLEAPYLTPDAGAARSPARAPPPAATRRCSPSASGPRSATPSPREWLADARLRVDRRLPRRDVPSSCSTRPACSPTPTPAPCTADELAPLRPCRAVAGDDDRVARTPTSTATAARPTRRPSGGWPRSRPPASWPSRSPPASSSASARPAPTASTRSRRSPTSHRRHGHVQEVIVQNFLPKPGTAMHARAAVPARRVPRGRSPLARLILPRRRPPAGAAEPLRRLRRAARRRHRRLGRRLARHRRPREPRAAVARARPAARGHRGARASRWRPRLTIYPEFALDPERWLDPALRFPVLDRSDAEGLGRDDPGAVFPRASSSSRNVRRRRRGRCSSVDRSTAWYSGADVRSAACSCPAARSRRQAPSREVLDGVLLGQEVGDRRDRHAVLAPAARRSPRSPRWPTSCAAQTVGDVVTCVRNRNINYTNVCTFKCRFCGFSKGPLSLNLRGTPYLLDARRHRRPRASRRVELRRHRGVPAGRHPSRLRRRLLHRRRPGGEGGRARHPRARLHRARGHRGRQAARRAARRLPAPPHGRRPRARCPAPRPRSSTTRSGRSSAPTRSTPRSGSRRTAPRTGRPALERHDHVRLGRAARCTGPATSCAPATCRRRPAASPSSCRCRSCTWRRRSTSSARPAAGPTFREVAAHARRRPHRLPRLDRQHPGVVGEARRRRARASCCRPASTTSAAR